jgi:EpsI family protein
VTSRRALVISTAILLAASVYVNFFLNKGETKVPREPLSSIPKSFDGWESADQAFPTEVLKNLGVDEYLMRRFTKGNESVWLYVGYYKSQKEGAMPHSPRHCYPGSGFNPIQSDIVSIPVIYPGVREIHPNRYIFAKGAEREIVIYWYQSRGRVIANEYVEKLYLIHDAILRNRSDGALIRFSMAATAETEESAFRRLFAFVSEFYPNFPRVIPD